MHVSHLGVRTGIHDRGLTNQSLTINKRQKIHVKHPNVKQSQQIRHKMINKETSIQMKSTVKLTLFSISALGCWWIKQPFLVMGMLLKDNNAFFKKLYTR